MNYGFVRERRIVHVFWLQSCIFQQSKHFYRLHNVFSFVNKWYKSFTLNRIDATAPSHVSHFFPQANRLSNRSARIFMVPNIVKTNYAFNKLIQSRRYTMIIAHLKLVHAVESIHQNNGKQHQFTFGSETAQSWLLGSTLVSILVQWKCWLCQFTLLWLRTNICL